MSELQARVQRAREDAWGRLVVQMSPQEQQTHGLAFADFHAMLCSLELPQLLGACVHVNSSAAPMARSCAIRCAREARAAASASERAALERELLAATESAPEVPLSERLGLFGLKPIRRKEVVLPKDPLMHARCSDEQIACEGFQACRGELDSLDKRMRLVCADGSSKECMAAVLQLRKNGCACLRASADEYLAELLGVVARLFCRFRVYRGFEDRVLVVAESARVVAPLTRRRCREIAAKKPRPSRGSALARAVARFALPPRQPPRVCSEPTRESSLWTKLNLKLRPGLHDPRQFR
jgi:hypothetical protein